MNPARILFVDDDQLILNALRRALSKEGFDLHFCADPLDAPRQIAEHGIQVIVSDYMMPFMCGVELLSLVRFLHPKVVRIMMTGQADKGATIRAINEGAISRYIEKHWEDAALKRSLHEAVKQVAAAPIVGGETPPPARRSIVRDAHGAIVLPSFKMDAVS